jgi:putative NADH-flavin reductase
MTIALIGASGYVGSAILHEALWRGHHVTAVVRNTAKLVAQPGLTAITADVLDTASLGDVLAGHTAVISAFSGHSQAQIREYYVSGLRSIIAAVKQASVPRLLVVGGAGSLDVAPGVQLVDTPHFPAQWKQTAEGARDGLRLLREEQELDWTMLSPSALLERGMRTGKFRLGTDQLLVDAAGESYISIEDYAVAMIDELERPTHSRQRFTVGY